MQKGIQLSIAENPQVIILDDQVQNSKAFDVCLMLKAMPQLRDIPVVLVSSPSETENHRIPFLNIGIEAFLTKPIDNAVLVGLLRILTRTYSSGKEQLVKDELKKSEERFKQVAKSAGIWIWEVDANGLYTYCSDAEETILGYKPEEVVGKLHFYDFYAPQHKEELTRRAFEAFNQKLSIKNFENSNLHKDGHVVILETTGLPVLDDLGNLTGYMGADKDISQRIEVEKILREREEKYRYIFENVQDIYYEATIDGTIREVSPSVELILNGLYHREDLIGKSIKTFYANEEQRNILISKIIDQGSVKDFEVTFHNEEGLSRHFSLSAKLNFDANGNPEKIIGSLYDLTLRKQTEEELRLAMQKAEESNRLKTALLTNMSHEVRTPMNAIMGFSYLLPDANEADRKIYADIIVKSSNHLLRLMDDVILISRLQSEKMALDLTSFKPSNLLNDVFQMFQHVDLNKGLEIRISNGKQFRNLTILSDANKIRQVLINLVSNAIKYTSHGFVELGYNFFIDHIEFFVKDTGMGIPQKEFQRIFETFYRSEQALSQAIRGNGLGLNIAKELVELMGGKIGVSSEVNIGSRFSFTVPVDSSSVLKFENRQKRIPSEDISEMSILVAEDEPINFQYIKTLLENRVKKIDHALNGKIAVDMVSTTHYDLVLMDLKMPVMGGLEATKIIKEMHPSVRIIVQTAYTFAEEQELAYQAGCDDLISKPIQEEVLLESIRKYAKTPPSH